MTLHIDVWSDIACPWCLIGKVRFDAAVASLPFGDQLEVVYHSWQLDPGLPEHYHGTEAEYLASAKGLEPGQVHSMLEQVSEVAAGEGLHYDFDKLVVANSLLAHRLLHGARVMDAGGATSGLQSRVKESLLRGHFEQGKDIGDRSQLVEMAAAAGMDAEAAEQVLDQDELDIAIEVDLNAARGYGITGVPFYVVDNRYGLAGAMPTQEFVAALTQAWQEKQAASMAIKPLGDAGGACGPQGC